MTSEYAEANPRYTDLADLVGEYECSSCGWFHDEDEAWGMGHGSDRSSCPKCNNILAFSEELNEPDHDPNRFTGFNGRKVR